MRAGWRRERCVTTARRTRTIGNGFGKAGFDLPNRNRDTGVSAPDPVLALTRSLRDRLPPMRHREHDRLAPSPPPLLSPRFRVAFACLLALLVPAFSAADTLFCHVSYGGDTRLLAAEAVDSPYTAPVQAIGSYFLFRMVLETRPADRATVKLYVFADREGGPAPIHQATHPYPPVVGHGSRHGFTGLNHVYEPLRDGELAYWCELSSSGERRP